MLFWEYFCIISLCSKTRGRVIGDSKDELGKVGMEERTEVMSHIPDTQELPLQVMGDHLESYRLYQACSGLFDLHPLIFPLSFIDETTFFVLLIQFV